MKSAAKVNTLITSLSWVPNYADGSEHIRLKIACVVNNIVPEGNEQPVCGFKGWIEGDFKVAAVGGCVGLIQNDGVARSVDFYGCLILRR